MWAFKPFGNSLIKAHIGSFSGQMHRCLSLAAQRLGSTLRPNNTTSQEAILKRPVAFTPSKPMIHTWRTTSLVSPVQMFAVSSVLFGQRSINHQMQNLRHDSTFKKRRKKMNKHKLKKRRKKLRMQNNN